MNIIQKTSVILVLSILGIVTLNIYLIGIAEILTLAFIIERLFKFMKVKITFWRIKNAINCLANGGTIKSASYFFHSAYKFNGK
jgi:hypothetical protein